MLDPVRVKGSKTGVDICNGTIYISTCKVADYGYTCSCVLHKASGQEVLNIVPPMILRSAASH